MDPLLIASLFLNVIILIVVFLLWRKGGSGDTAGLAQRLDALDTALSRNFKDVAVQMEKTRGDLNAEIARELSSSLNNLRVAVDDQLTKGRGEQSASLAQTTQNLETKFAELVRTQNDAARLSREEVGKSLEAIRGEVQARLTEITGQVQEKLEKNIKEGFTHFSEVQKYLKSAEEQLRSVGDLGNSIQDLNKLLQLPHLRGKFGEESLERLLHDFLGPSLYELQFQLEGGIVDAVIKFPGRVLPIDAKFPREQVSELFEAGASDPARMTEARKKFEQVMKAQAKKIQEYIHPEHGTTDIALMYLPSETLYMEAVRNRGLWEDLIKLKVLPVSPNTLLVTLECVAMVHKWYKVQEGLAKSIEEFGKAQKSFQYFESKFEVIGKSLERAQDAFGTAQKHLGTYKRRVSQMSGSDDLPELEAGDTEASPPAGDNH
ncbi:MAG: DNA recombination protein RmuC [Acidobacteriales bacterium]|nr:DNA recombination protein RmuC [Terriglobales bacterium]